MTKAAIVARLKKIYAAEDYFTGVLGSRASAFKPRPKPPGSKPPLVKESRASRTKTAKVR